MTPAGSPDNSSPFSAPRTVERLDHCRFYHTMDLPGFGTVEGPWDLRAGVDDYLGGSPGGVAFAGRRVLEIGTASGFLCFEMERRGAEVVAYDLTDRADGWDIVPFDGTPDQALVAERAEGMRSINNAWWLAHRVLGSSARVVYGSVYDLPESIGPVDTAVFGAVLLHLRDPFLALQRALVLTRDSVIVTDVASRAARALGRLPATGRLALVRSGRLPADLGFMPDARTGGPIETWWRLTPWAVARMLGVLGFDVTRVLFHAQLFQGAPCPMYTVVARRQPAATPAHSPRSEAESSALRASVQGRPGLSGSGVRRRPNREGTARSPRLDVIGRFDRRAERDGSEPLTRARSPGTVPLGGRVEPTASRRPFTVTCRTYSYAALRTIRTADAKAADSTLAGGISSGRDDPTVWCHFPG